MDGQTPHNLPEQPNTILGRDQDLIAARDLLLSSDVRLLSLTGPPGVGKTRLAMAVAENCLEAFPQGVWLIDLTSLRDPSLVGPKIASCFGIAERKDDTVLDSLTTYFRGCQILLLLDNFEGVLPAAAWVGRLLERTSGLKILTTSRERLHLRWERTILVAPLSLPDPSLSFDLSRLEEFPAISLFVQRATAVNHHFSLSPDNAPVIASLCARLDGLPLAIELAAAHANVLSPTEILANMDDRFHLLGMGALDLPERHQTLKAAIDWSYESLPPELRQFLRRLGVFTGGFSLQAAEVVGECEALGLDALASLIALVEKNLVIRAQGPAGETRFTLLESIRDYLLDQLQVSGELEDTRRRHAAYYLGLAERNYAEMKGSHQRSWIDRLESEHDNLRAAMQWSLDTGERSTGKRIAAALWIPFWWLQGHIQEGLHWLEIFRGNGRESQDLTHLRVLEGIGMLRAWQGDYEPGKALLMDALDIAQRWEDQEAIVRILAYLGWIFWVNGKTEQAAWLAESIEMCSQDVDPWELAYAYLSLGILYFEAGEDAGSEKAMARSLEYFQFTEEKQQGVIFAGHKLALLRARKGDLQEAKVRMTEALEASRQLNDLHVIALCVDDTVQLVAQSMTDQNLTQGQGPEKVARVLGAVDRWREALSLPRSPREKSAYHQVKENLREWLGEERFLLNWQAGQMVSDKRAIDEANELLETANQPRRVDRRLPDREEISITLSERERQVIGLVAEGLTNQEIADRLFITERTVRFHITSIFNKLGANNRVQAIAIARRQDLLLK